MVAMLLDVVFVLLFAATIYFAGRAAYARARCDFMKLLSIDFGWGLVVAFKRLNAGAIIPRRAHATDSGLDLNACADVTIEPGACFVVPTGIAAIIPPDFELQVRPRSGLSSRGIMAAWGTVDQGYRGEIRVTLHNTTSRPYAVKAGDRIAQLVAARTYRLPCVETEKLPDDTDRGAAGFGSTGR